MQPQSECFFTYLTCISATVLAPKQFKNSNGAGDTFVGVTIAALATGIKLRDAVTAGEYSASRTHAHAQHTHFHTQIFSCFEFVVVVVVSCL